MSDIHHPRRDNRSGDLSRAISESAEKLDSSDKFFKRGNSTFHQDFKVKRSVFTVARIAKYTGLLVLISILGYGTYLLASKDDSIKSAQDIYANFKQISKDIGALNTGSVDGLIAKINGDLGSLKNKTGPLNLAPVLNEIPKTIGLLGEVSGKVGALNKDLTELKTNGFKDFMSKPEKSVEGVAQSSLAGLLEDANKNIKDLSSLSADLRNAAAKFDLVPSGVDAQYLKSAADLNQLTEFLDAAIPILKSEGERHFLVMFENPTEIRPAGGFLGSYGDITLSGGSISSIDVNDIYYATHFASDKIIPPAELQSITTAWSPQDANWFFDFPTSAKKTADFIENSAPYSDNKIAYEGVISLNVRIVEDLLKITGPIDIPEYNITLNETNFLPEVQREVEQGKDKKPGQNPKKVLKFIMPVLLDRLGHLSDQDKLAVLDIFRNRFLSKDIQIYFKDPIFENMAVQYGVGGEVFDLPQGNADYLAVVDANVAGGKSDMFISQKINLRSEIDPLGVLNNSLTVSRASAGGHEADWWYNSINQNYIKIFTAPGFQLESIKGNSKKTIKPPIDYAKAGYHVDPELSAVENTKKLIASANSAVSSENGKDVFGTWFNVKPGESRDLVLNYTNAKKLDLTPGSKFQFVFEKQSGVESVLNYSIDAPSGFIWREAKGPTFSYVNDKLPARVIINLTLDKEQ